MDITEETNLKVRIEISKELLLTYDGSDSKRSIRIYFGEQCSNRHDIEIKQLDDLLTALTAMKMKLSKIGKG